MLFRKLPGVSDPDSLVLLRWTSGPVFPFSSLNGNGKQDPDGLSSTSFALVAFREMQAAVKGSVDLVGFADLYDVNISIDGRAEIANANAVSGNYFDVLGVPPQSGRSLGDGRQPARRAAGGDDQRCLLAAALRPVAGRRRPRHRHQRHPVHHRRRDRGAASAAPDRSSTRPTSSCRSRSEAASRAARKKTTIRPTGGCW